MVDPSPCSAYSPFFPFPGREIDNDDQELPFSRYLDDGEATGRLFPILLSPLFDCPSTRRPGFFPVLRDPPMAFLFFFLFVLARGDQRVMVRQGTTDIFFPTPRARRGTSRERLFWNSVVTSLSLNRGDACPHFSHLATIALLVLSFFPLYK